MWRNEPWIPPGANLDGVELVDARPKVVGVPPEGDLQQRQEAVHPRQQTLRPDGEKTRPLDGDHPDVSAPRGRSSRVSQRLPGGNAIEHDDSVGEVRRHDEVVLHHKRRLLGVEDVPADKRQIRNGAPHRPGCATAGS